MDADRMLKTCIMVRQLLPESRMVMIIEQVDVDPILHCLNAGVFGILLEATSCQQLAGVLRLIMLGQRIIPTEVVEKLGEPSLERHSVDWNAMSASVNLSAREIEILKCLVAGEANKVISRRLNITEATVKVHIKAILRKLHVLNRTQAAIWAVVRGLRRLEEVPNSQAEIEQGLHSAGA
jgi:two-component system nitrate/nitrite response regulator NarL